MKDNSVDPRITMNMMMFIDRYLINTLFDLCSAQFDVIA